jgi:hypothetical protein
MRGLDDGPDGLNEAAFNRALGGGRKMKTKTKTKTKRKPSPPRSTLVSSLAAGTACVCGHAVEEHGHDDQYPGSTACSECPDVCVAYEANDL